LGTSKAIQKLLQSAAEVKQRFTDATQLETLPDELQTEWKHQLYKNCVEYLIQNTPTMFFMSFLFQTHIVVKKFT